MKEEIALHGFAIISGCVNSARVSRLRQVFDELQSSEYARHHGEHLFAVRNVLAVSNDVQSLASSSAFMGIARDILGENARPVKALLFDKTEGANWRVPFHQDLTIAVTQRHDVEGYAPWTVKAGIPHVQPPLEVLEEMLTLRLHLDDCSAENGALKLIPKSHRLGKLRHEQIQAITKAELATICALYAGDLLLMKPLLLHASSPATTPAHRRVIHIEYCAAQLADGLEWIAVENDSM